MDIGLTNSNLCHSLPHVSAPGNKLQVDALQLLASQAYDVPFLGKMAKQDSPPPLPGELREILRIS